MLFPYTYVPHQIEKMQVFIDFIFHEVWCKAPTSGDYSLDLFVANPDLHEVMTALHYDDGKGAMFFAGHVERIYGLFSALTAAQISDFQQWYRGNNDLEKACANDPAVPLARYKDVISAYPILGKKLAEFFRGLYDNSTLGLSAIKGKIGDIKDHNKKFFEINKVGKCPFCGINDLKGIHHTRREAYDHYLPKYRYPFNSINFQNLAPACHECNSVYKLSKDPAHNDFGRRKAFYPYVTGPTIEIQVTLQHSGVANLTPADINLKFGPAVNFEEIETWKDVYGIEERYKAKFCSADASDWIEQFRILNRRRAYSASEYIEDIAQSDPFANVNFLKQAFMQCCQDIGLLAAIEKYS